MSSLSGEVPRHTRSLAREILSDTPLLVVQGARQVGKSTLLRQVLSPDDSVFVTLDDPTTRRFAEEDPVQFLRQAPGKTLAIDEAQRVPDLALALKLVIDEQRIPGAYAITGSADLLRLKGTGDSLAGRASSLTVRPLSQGEIGQRSDPEDFISWVANGCAGNLDSSASPSDIRERVTAGGYPEPLKRSTFRARSRWFKDYVDQLLRHDVPQLAGESSQMLQSFEPLIRLLASQGESELVVARLAERLGIVGSTLRMYLDTLDTMFLTETLPSWGRGYSGRVVRRPKLSLVDTGLASSITGFTPEASHQAGGFEFFGAQLEAFVSSELKKQQTWSETIYRLYHYRQRNDEVDIVVELQDGSVILMEVKSTSQVRRDSWTSLRRISEKLGARVRASVVLYTGEKGYCIDESQSLYVLPVGLLWEHASIPTPLPSQ